MAGKNNKKGRGVGGSKGGGTTNYRNTSGAIPSGTIAADYGTRSLRRAIRNRPNEAFNERLVAATGRMTPSLASMFNGRSGDYYRKGTGNKSQGTGRMPQGTGTTGNPAKPGDRITITDRSGSKATYKVANSAGPRPVGARTFRRRVKA
jgi:hypothetical protein